MFRLWQQWYERVEAVIGEDQSEHVRLSPDIHRLLWSSDQADAREAARVLNNLRSERNAADYDLDAAKFRKQAFAFQWVEMADRARAAIERCRQEPALSEIRSRLFEP